MSRRYKTRETFFSVYKIVRGASVESGGFRELSSGFLSDKIRQKTVALVRSLPGRLLEIGCGEGIFLEHVSNAGHQKHCGVEVVPKMLDRTKTRFRKNGMAPPFLVNARGEALPFLRGTFDRVVCVNTLHNQPSIQAVRSILRDMAGACKPGGFIVCDVRNRLNPIMYLAYRYAHLYDSSCKSLPLNTFVPFEIERIFNSFEFSIVKRSPVLFPVAWLAPAIVFQARNEKKC